MAFTLPLQVLLNLTFCHLTKRKMNFNLTYLFDIAICCCMIIWFYKYDINTAAENDGLGLGLYAMRHSLSIKPWK